jgi:hypothetical protein
MNPPKKSESQRPSINIDGCIFICFIVLETHLAVPPHGALISDFFTHREAQAQAQAQA